jgi:uncharacterized FlaG/YvyC family protein
MSIGLSKTEMKALYKSAMRELILEERQETYDKELELIKEYIKAKEQKHQLTLCNVINEITDAEWPQFSFDWCITNWIPEEQKESFEKELEHLNDKLNELLAPVKEFVQFYKHRPIHQLQKPKITDKRLLKQFKDVLEE